MNKAKIIEALNMTIAGLSIIRDEIETEINGNAVMPAPMEEAPESGEVITGKFSIEDLNNMKYNEFKKLASSLGVKCTGTRDEIMERILALDVVITDGDAEVSEPEEEPVKAPAKSAKSGTGKKLGGKKADEPAKDEFDEQAEEIAKNTPVEDIIGALADVDIKATKKNAVKKLAEALREGLIELDGEEEDTAEEAGAEDDEDIDSSSYFPQYDPNGYNNPDGMSEERAEDIEAKMDEIITAYSEGELTDEDVASYVEENATDEEIDLLGDEYTEEDVFKLYMELVKRTIDNDGEEHEPGEAYEVGNKDFCCGHELKYVKKTKKYVCSSCGEEYEAE